MKILSARQWDMLELAAGTRGASISLNLNTISSLYTRDLVYFKHYAPRKDDTPYDIHRVKITQLGSKFLHNRKRFEKKNNFSKAREMVHEIRGDV